jgi:hypothetical protein
MHASTRDSPTLLGRACGAIQLKNPASMVVLGAASYPLSGNVARAQGGGPVGLRQSFFFLMPLKFMSVLSKNNYVLYFVILLILTFTFLIIIYFAF